MEGRKWSMENHNKAKVLWGDMKVSMRKEE